MTDAKTLLARHVPRLAYDSMEAYFADSAAIWTDSPFTQLRRADGTVLAAAPELSLAFLGPKAYGDGSPVLKTDVIGETTRDYAKHGAALHAQSRYANQVHGAVRKDDQGRTWLQYWFFYYYNNFQVIGPLLSAGNHEGDWEMIQLLLDADEQPVTAVYAQHKGGESRPWPQVARAGADPNSPVIYVARGSHAAYFTAGQHWTGTWWDNADGKGPHLTPALVVLADTQPGWAHWPGFWGDTKGTGVNSTSPIGPGPHRQWRNPALLAAEAAAAAAAAKPAPPPVPAAPKIAVRREGDRAVVSYELPDPAAGLVVAVRPAGAAAPAETHAVAVEGATGELEVPLDGDGAFDVHASAASPSGAASASTSVAAAPAGPRHN